MPVYQITENQLNMKILKSFMFHIETTDRFIVKQIIQNLKVKMVSFPSSD